jgi:flavodoxin I
MSLLKKLNLTGSNEGPAKFGISKGDEPGHLGIWGVWKDSENLEVFRIVLRAQSQDRKAPAEASYTLAPAKEKSFVQFIETTQEMKQFLVGSDKARSGEVSVQLWLNNQRTRALVYSLTDVIECLRGKGSKAPQQAEVGSGYLSIDSKEIASMAHSELKDYSEKVKAEIAEKLRKAEEERIRIEEEKKAALAKAQAEAAAKAAKPTAQTTAGGAPVDRSKPTLTPAKTAIFFGSSTGNTANVAELLKKELGSVDYLKNITDIHPVDLAVVENIIIGIPTWHIGELQDDWAAMLPEVKALSFAGKKVAVFGLGDGKGYADTYVDGMAELLEPFEKGGAKLCGQWPTDGYEFKKSKAIRDGKFLGLVIDVENQDNLTDKRVKSWAALIQKEMGL